MPEARPHTPATRLSECATSSRIEIATGEMLRGTLPDRALRMVREWSTIHRDELAENWQRTQIPDQPAPIAPLP